MQLHYLSKKTLNSTAAPERVVLTISPVTMIGFGELGNLKVMAISCPMDNGSVVLIKIPEPLMSYIDALNSESEVLQLTMMAWSSSNNFLASFLFFTNSVVICR